MGVTKSDIDDFYQFATKVLAGEVDKVSLEDLLWQWREKRVQDDTIASIRQSIEDEKAGRMRSMDEVAAEIRARLGFPDRDG